MLLLLAFSKNLLISIVPPDSSPLSSTASPVSSVLLIVSIHALWRTKSLHFANVNLSNSTVFYCNLSLQYCMYVTKLLHLLTLFIITQNSKLVFTYINSTRIQTKLTLLYSLPNFMSFPALKLWHLLFDHWIIVQMPHFLFPWFVIEWTNVNFLYNNSCIILCIFFLTYKINHLMSISILVSIIFPSTFSPIKDCFTLQTSLHLNLLSSNKNKTEWIIITTFYTI